MAYADRNVGGSRVIAVVMVAIILAVVGYGFVTGLAYKYVKKVQEKLNTFDVQEPPPPPEKLPPPPPPDKSVPPPPVFTPPAIVQTIAPPPTIVTTVVPPPPPAPVVVAPPAPPPPAPPKIAKPPVPRGSPNDWVTTDDYPPSALRSGDQGVVGFRLDVGADGKVTNCSIVSSSGSSLLDSTACNLLKRRGRFAPAEDTTGAKVAGGYVGRIRWQIPQD